MSKVKITCPICDNEIEVNDNTINHTCPVCKMDIFVDAKYVEANKPKPIKQASHIHTNDSKIDNNIFETKTNDTQDFNQLSTLINQYRDRKDYVNALTYAIMLNAQNPDNPMSLYYLAVCTYENTLNSNKTSTITNPEIKSVLDMQDMAIEELKDLPEYQLTIKQQQESFVKLVLEKDKKEEIEKIEKYKKKVENHDVKSKQKIKRLPKSSIYEEPDPTPFFPNKAIKYIFITIAVFAALALFAITRTTGAERLAVIYGAVLSITLLLAWVIRYFIKNHKKIDSTEPTLIRRIRKVVQILFFIVAGYTIFTGLGIYLYETFPDLMAEILVNTNIPYEYIKLKVLLFGTGALLLILMTIFSINQIRIENYLMRGGKSKQFIDVNAPINFSYLPNNKKQQGLLITICDNNIEKLQNEIDKLSKTQPEKLIKNLKEKVNKV